MLRRGTGWSKRKAEQKMAFYKETYHLKALKYRSTTYSPSALCNKRYVFGKVNNAYQNIIFPPSNLITKLITTVNQAAIITENLHEDYIKCLSSNDRNFQQDVFNTIKKAPSLQSQLLLIKIIVCSGEQENEYLFQQALNNLQQQHREDYQTIINHLICFAIDQQCKKLLKMLLLHGALLQPCKHQKYVESEYHHAVRFQPPMISFLFYLQNKYSNIRLDVNNQNEHGVTPLMLLMSDHINTHQARLAYISKYLIQFLNHPEMNINLTDNNGMNVLQRVFASDIMPTTQQIAICQIFMRHSNIDVSHTDNFGNNILHYCTSKSKQMISMIFCSKTIIPLIVKKGCNIFALNEDNDSPMGNMLTPASVNTNRPVPCKIGARSKKIKEILKIIKKTQTPEELAKNLECLKVPSKSKKLYCNTYSEMIHRVPFYFINSVDFLDTIDQHGISINVEAPHLKWSLLLSAFIRQNMSLARKCLKLQIKIPKAQTVLCQFEKDHKTVRDLKYSIENCSTQEKTLSELVLLFWACGYIYPPYHELPTNKISKYVLRHHYPNIFPPILDTLEECALFKIRSYLQSTTEVNLLTVVWKLPLPTTIKRRLCFGVNYDLL